MRAGFAQKSNGIFCKRSSVIYAWINKNRKNFPIYLMCRVLKVSKSCYYSWVFNGSRFNKIDVKLYELVKEIFKKSNRTYGTIRIKEELEDDYGVLVSRKLIAKIMKYYNLKAKIKRKFVNTTDSDHNNEIAPNILNRDFYASNPDEKYVGDRNVKKIYLYMFF